MRIHGYVADDPGNFKFFTLLILQGLVQRRLGIGKIFLRYLFGQYQGE